MWWRLFTAGSQPAVPAAAVPPWCGQRAVRRTDYNYRRAAGQPRPVRTAARCTASQVHQAAAVLCALQHSLQCCSIRAAACQGQISSIKKYDLIGRLRLPGLGAPLLLLLTLLCCPAAAVLGSQLNCSGLIRPLPRPRPALTTRTGRLLGTSRLGLLTTVYKANRRK